METGCCEDLATEHRSHSATAFLSKLLFDPAGEAGMDIAPRPGHSPPTACHGMHAFDVAILGGDDVPFVQRSF